MLDRAVLVLSLMMSACLCYVFFAYSIGSEGIDTRDDKRFSSIWFLVTSHYQA